jgi:uncharacterized protein
MTPRLKRLSSLILLAAFLVLLHLPEASATSFLWKVSSRTNTLYLLGSTHMADESLYPLSSTIEDAFAKSDYLVVEADIAKGDDLESASLMLSQGMYQDGRSLKGSIPEDLFRRLNNELQQFGMGGEELNMMKPWLAALTVAQLRMAALGYKPELGIDVHFLNKARGNKKILQLESVGFQVRLLSGFSPHLQTLFLEDALEDTTTMKDDLQRMFQYWKSGDSVGMEGLLFKNVARKPELKSLYVKMLDERNVKMVEKIDRYLKDSGTYFVVVGAGHLLGNNGIVNLLKAKGYVVEHL